LLSFYANAKLGFLGHNYFPENMEREQYYTPKADGREKEIKSRLERWAQLREQMTRDG